ncbi:hypothetical protein [Neorhizobium tomejilense]|uniref:hypothetical protein n=1 Tax=Neorhizobium tomejilense TaxID=2093828 RepID=UPI000CFA3354|nr:hypothetical protein [Neorhizobium tomejilense]
MIRFSPAESVSPEPIKTPIAPVVDVAVPTQPAPILELEPTPEATSRAKSTKPRSPKRKLAPAAEIVPQLDLEAAVGDKKENHDD